jgi:hypothetical protein
VLLEGPQQPFAVVEREAHLLSAELLHGPDELADLHRRRLVPVGDQLDVDLHVHGHLAAGVARHARLLV